MFSDGNGSKSHLKAVSVKLNVEFCHFNISFHIYAEIQSEQLSILAENVLEA